MGDFNRDRGGFRRDRGGFGGGSRSFGGGSSRGGFGRDRGDREMFDAICSECGKDCKLPFEPKTDKPVYCSECFEKVSEENGGNSRRDEGRRSSRNDSPKENLGEKLDLLNIKLDTIIELLSGDKKVKKSTTKETFETIEEIKETPIKKALKIKKEEIVKDKKVKKPTKKAETKKAKK